MPRAPLKPLRFRNPEVGESLSPVWENSTHIDWTISFLFIRVNGLHFGFFYVWTYLQFNSSNQHQCIPIYTCALTSLPILPYFLLPLSANHLPPISTFFPFPTHLFLYFKVINIIICYLNPIQSENCEYCRILFWSILQLDTRFILYCQCTL